MRTSASVLNYNEVDGCHGRYLTINPPLPYTLGMECVGEVVGTGAGAEAWIGKRVTASGRGATGAHAELAVGPTAMAFEAPEQLDDAEAAAFFYPFHLAHLGLHERGRLAGGRDRAGPRRRRRRRFGGGAAGRGRRRPGDRHRRQRGEGWRSSRTSAPTSSSTTASDRLRRTRCSRRPAARASTSASTASAAT